MWTFSSKTISVTNQIESRDRTKHDWDGKNNVIRISVHFPDTCRTTWTTYSLLNVVLSLFFSCPRLSDVPASLPPMVVDIIWFSGQTGVEKQTTTPQRVSVPHSALPFPEDSTALFQLRCSVNWGLRPRLFRVVSAATSSVAAIHLNSCPIPCWLQGCARCSVPSRLQWRLASSVGSEAPLFSEICQHPIASFSSSRQLYLDGIKNVSQSSFLTPCSRYGP